MVYYLSAIYEDMSTRLGTHANRVFKGSDINRVIQNFKKTWNGTVDKGQKIIGVEVEICQRTYSDGIKKRFFFNERDVKLENKEVFEYVE